MALPTPKTNEGIATTRTAWFTGVVLYLITLINEVILPEEIALPTWVAPAVAAAVIGVLYRLSLLMADKFSWWGVVLFLLNRAPGYTPPPPVDPVANEVPAPNERDAGQVPNNLIWTIVGILLIIVLLAMIL